MADEQATAAARADSRSTSTSSSAPMVEKGASDLHITTGSPPLLRIDGSIVPLKLPPLEPVDTKQLCYSMLTEEQRANFEKHERARPLVRREGPLALPRQHLHAARRGGRRVPHDPVQDPHASRSSACRRSSPSSPTSRAAWCSSPGRPARASRRRSRRSSTRSTPSSALHIITIEDPIEYLHPHKLSIVNQREVGADTEGFKNALKYVLRQDPDVVLVGEMRDLETIEAALTIARRATSSSPRSTPTAPSQTINRIIDVFPPHQQAQVRAQLSFVLAGRRLAAAPAARTTRPGACWRSRSWSPTPPSGT